MQVNLDLAAGPQPPAYPPSAPWPPPIHPDDDTLLGYPKRISESYFDERQNWTPKWQKYSYWVVGPALLFAALIGAVFAFNIHEQREFARTQQVTNGKITRIDERTNQIYYAFTVGGKAYEGASRHPPIQMVNQRFVRVCYNPRNPADCRLIDGTKTSYMPVLVFYLWVFGMFSIAALRIRTHRRARAYRRYLYSLTTRVPPPPRPR